MKRTDKLLCGFYAAIAAAALIGTWQQNLAFFALPGDHGVAAFIGAASANPAAASISIDIAFFSLAAFVWMAVEARRLGVRFVWVYIALSCLIAVSVMFPLFLIARQMRLVGNRAAT